MKEIKTYEDLLTFADSFLHLMNEIPPNLILCFELNTEDYCQLMTGIPLIQYNQYQNIVDSEFFTLKYAQLTFKITIKK